MTAPSFVDKARLVLSAGRGGDGCLSFRREKYVELGGPDGGNGGRGGDVWLEADPQKTTLADFVYKPHFKAPSGGNGGNTNKTGRSGEDLVIRLPPGTLIFRDGKLLCDLKAAGDRFLAARGGRGGRGNASFRSPTNTAPRLAEKGEAGETWKLDLELKLLADVGLVGFPNAGKSTLLSRVTKAHPKIADYPFTTLAPNLGVAHVGGRSFVVADIPGLIEGAHAGKGLGDEFLRHVERTRLLIHLVDVGGFEARKPHDAFRALNRELGLHSPSLKDKPQIVVATKMDLTDADARLAAFKKRLKKTPLHAISAVTGRGVAAMLAAVARALDKTPGTPLFVPPAFARYDIEPDFHVERTGGVFRLTGKKVERLVQMTNFDQDEAVARLQRIFRKMGVDKALQQKGVASGDLVTVGDYEFTYKPEPRA